MDLDRRQSIKNRLIASFGVLVGLLGLSGFVNSKLIFRDQGAEYDIDDLRKVSVDGVTITGDGTPANPLVGAVGGVVVDGVTITGTGVTGDPLVSQIEEVATLPVSVEKGKVVFLNTNSRLYVGVD
jgi:hypothetical protein